MIKWDKETNLWLLTPYEFDQLPDGLEVTSISGDKKVKGKDYVDQDVQFGHIAYGVIDPENHPLKNLLLLFMVKK